LFQAICRVNRLDSEDKEFGYIVDYRDLFNAVGEAVSVYTSELDTDNFEAKDIDILLQDRLVAGKERLDNALEDIAILCESVAPPKDALAYQHYFCGNTEKPEDLKATEVQRTALYKKTVALIRAYANIVSEMEEAGYTSKEIENIKKEVDFYLKLREEIRQASGEKLDMKTYEADMRHLIDTYIQAEDPETISPFGDMSLLDIIVKSGIADAINSMAGGIKGSREAIAETIENNVRKKIIKEHLIDPAFFEKMSKLLEEIIKERKANAISYEEYLQKIADIATQVTEGKSDDTPTILNTPGRRALYNNLDNNDALAVKIDERIKKESPADWRGHTPKENVIKRHIFEILSAELKGVPADELVAEPPEGYGLKTKVEKIFNILNEQKEY
jgi:type I restriction enzyme R subunit